MNKLKQFIIPILIIIIVMLLSGCGDQRLLEQLGFSQTISYDLVDENNGNGENDEDTKNKLKITISLPKVNTESGKIERELLTDNAPTSKEARIILASQTELMLVSGQLRNTLFGVKLAEQGLWEHIDTLLRDPSISPRLKITVVDGSAHDLLVKDYPAHPRTGLYIDHLLKKEADAQTIPKINLHEFTRDYFDDGIDPVVPIIKDNGKHISLDGIALFREDRYITKIKPDQALIFAMMRAGFTRGEISIDLAETGRENEHIMFGSIIGKRKIKASSNIENDHYRVDINMNIKGSVLEYIGDLHLDSDKDRKKLEGLISKYITDEAQTMIDTMQENNVDSIGLGRYIRNSLTYKEWSSLNWDEVYPNIEVHCHAKVVIKDYGEFEK